MVTACLSTDLISTLTKLHIQYVKVDELLRAVDNFNTSHKTEDTLFATSFSVFKTA